MKKLLSLVLALAICLSLSACGGSSRAKLSRSTYNEETRTFTSAYTGLTCVVPEGWTAGDDEYMASEYYDGITAEELRALTEEQLLEYETVYDYVVVSPTGKSFVAVTIQNAAKSYADAENPAQAFIDDAVAQLGGTTGEVTLGDNTYLTIYAEEILYNMAIAQRAISDTLVECISFVTMDGKVNYHYAWDMFCGGVKFTDVNNVPSLREYAETMYRYTNTDTGVTASIPYGWTGSGLGTIADEYYDMDENAYTAITKEEWAGKNYITDVKLSEDAGNNTVTVSYENTTYSSVFYGMSAEEYLDANMRRYISYVKSRTLGDDVVLNGRTFKTAKLDFSSYQVYLAAAPLNDDYLIVVMATTFDGKTMEDFARIFNEDMVKSSDNVLKPGSYDEISRHFENRQTGLGFILPQGWEIQGKEDMEALYWSDPSQIDIAAFTDADFAYYTYIPDFYAMNTSNYDDMFGCFVNRYNLRSGISSLPTFEEYVEMENAEHEEYGWTMEPLYAIDLSSITYQFYKGTLTEDGVNYTNYFGYAQYNEDYFLGLTFRTNVDSDFDAFGMFFDIK